MLATMRIPLFLAILAAVGFAGELDGRSAHPRRWAHTRGPASGSCVSQAEPLESLGEVIWTFRAKGTIDATPLTWDGLGYLRVGDELIAIDLETGKRRASQKIGAMRAAALGDGAVFIRQGAALQQWRRHNTSFRRRWTIDLSAAASAPCIYEGEVYVTSEGKLLRLRVGQSEPAWSQGSTCFGTPALMGDEVYALEKAGGKTIALVARARLDGSERARIEWDGGAGEGHVALNRDQVAVRIGGRWTLVRRKFKDGSITLDSPWNVPLKQTPLLYTSAAIGIGGEHGALMLFRHTKKGKHMRPLVTPGTRKDLFKGIGEPISMQDVMCTGLWMENLNANVIRWHLHERPKRKLLPAGVAYRPVPATDERLMLVAKDKKSVICVAPEVIGS